MTQPNAQVFQFPAAVASPVVRLTVISAAPGGGTGEKVISTDGSKTTAHIETGFATIHEAPLFDLLDRDFAGNECLTPGAPIGLTPGQSAAIMPQNRASGGATARTNKAFGFEVGAPGVLVIDNDPKGAHEAVPAILFHDPAALRQLIATVCPGVLNAAAVAGPSSSCGDVVDAAGNVVSGSRGSHLYVPVKNQADLPRALKALADRLILSGHGSAFITKSGAIQVRTPIDASLGQPSRLVFRAPARLAEGLHWKHRPDRVKWTGGLLDTETEISDLSKDERAKLLSIVAEIKAKAGDMSAQRREARRVERPDLSDLQRVGEDEYGSPIFQLRGPERVEFMDGTAATAIEIAKNVARYQEKTCRDVEDPDYGGGAQKGIVYGRMIFSQAHGGVVYLLPNESGEVLMEKARAAGIEFKGFDANMSLAPPPPAAPQPVSVPDFAALASRAPIAPTVSTVAPPSPGLKLEFPDLTGVRSIDEIKSAAVADGIERSLSNADKLGINALTKEATKLMDQAATLDQKAQKKIRSLVMKIAAKNIAMGRAIKKAAESDAKKAYALQTQAMVDGPALSAALEGVGHTMESAMELWERTIFAAADREAEDAERDRAPKLCGVPLLPRRLAPPDNGDVSLSGIVLYEFVGRVAGGDFNRIAFVEGKTWVCRAPANVWEAIEDGELLERINSLNGLERVNEKGESVSYVMSRRGIDNITKNVREFLTPPVAEKFFDVAPDDEASLSLTDGQLMIRKDGFFEYARRVPEHRVRHVLPAKCAEVLAAISSGPLASAPLLSTLLDGSFKNEDDAAVKRQALQEMLSIAVCNVRFPDPALLVLQGEDAANGKSQFQTLAVSLMPPSSTATYNPCGSESRFALQNASGKRLLYYADLPMAGVRADELKMICDRSQMSCERKNKDAFDFVHYGLTMFGTNHALKPTSRHADNGFLRRLNIVKFNRVIPEGERVADIGKRIAEEEAVNAIAWFAMGASNIVRNGGKLSNEVRELFASVRDDAAAEADPIYAYIRQQVQLLSGDDVENVPATPTAAAHTAFQTWAKNENNRIAGDITRDAFTRRMGIALRRLTGTECAVRINGHVGRGFAGIKIEGATPIAAPAAICFGFKAPPAAFVFPPASH